MVIQTNTAQLAKRLSYHWHEEHLALNALVTDFRKWAYEVSQLGKPYFGEIALRLTELRDRLTQHFQLEDDLCRQFNESGRPRSPELDVHQRQTQVDHELLLTRLDGLIEQLQLPDPPFASWQEAIEQFEVLMDILDRHEQEEASNLEWLIPPNR